MRENVTTKKAHGGKRDSAPTKDQRNDNYPRRELIPKESHEVRMWA